MLSAFNAVDFEKIDIIIERQLPVKAKKSAGDITPREKLRLPCGTIVTSRIIHMVLLRGRVNFGFHEFFVCASQYASIHHGAEQEEAALRSSGKRQTRHLPQSRLTGAGSLLPPVYREAWAKGNATALDEHILEFIEDILSNPPTENKYIVLKSALLGRFTDSEEAKLKKLLGDRRPSDLLCHMKSLAGSKISEEFLKTLCKSGKLIAQLLNEASNSGSSYRLILFDKTSSRQYHVDTGADLSVIPPTQAEKRKPSDFKLEAANSTIIKTYGSKVLKLDLGLRRQFTWSFTIADVKKPILGTDFLKHFGLLVDLKRRRLLDSVTLLRVLEKTTECQALFLTTLDSSLYILEVLALLEEFKNITIENSNEIDVKYNVTHVIIQQVLQKIDEICLPPTIDYAAIATAQDTNLTSLSNYNLKFDKLPVIGSEYMIFCEVSTVVNLDLTFPPLFAEKSLSATAERLILLFETL
ncbi:uncharacterized protein TNCV_1350391 [Trichonephila clavipes]|nr:uncharacterized protein TNCV_1350391 [Trichonephila clavipes]